MRRSARLAISGHRALRRDDRRRLLAGSALRWGLVLSLLAAMLALIGCVALRSVAGDVRLPRPAGASSGLLGPSTPSDPAGALPGIGPIVAPAAGYVRVTIHWPPQFATQAIPSDTNTVALTVTDAAGKKQAHQEFGRPATATTVTATMSINAGNNLTFEAKTYRDASPVPEGANPTAQGTAAGVNIIRSQTTDVPIVLQSLSAPAIASFSVNVGKVGDTVTLYGSNLAPKQPDESVVKPAVIFNGATASVVTRIGDGEVRVVVPAGATCGNVVATVGNQISANQATFYVSTGVTVSATKPSWDPSPAGSLIVVSGATASLAADRRLVFAVGSSIASFSSAPVVSWSSSTQSIGVVDPESGVFTAGTGDVGTAATQVRASLGLLQSNAVTVQNLKVTRIAIDPADVTINVAPPADLTSAGLASTASLAAQVSNSLDLAINDVTWTSSDASLASISAGGVVTALKEGTPVVTARSTVDPTRTGTASIDVQIYGRLDVTVN